MLPPPSLTSPAVAHYFLRIYLPDLGSWIHFVSARLCFVVTGDCMALRAGWAAARWSGLACTKALVPVRGSHPGPCLLSHFPDKSKCINLEPPWPQSVSCMTP